MPKIFLDYGHGGNDPGAVSNGHNEKDIVLQIGLRVAYHLRRHNQTVIESRTGDTNPTLTERTNKAKANLCDLLVSLHCNSFSDETAQGVETYTYGTGSRELQLAKSVHNSIIKSKLYSKNRGIKQGNLHMVREFPNPAILVEMGFISNKKDREMLLNNIEDMAVVIAKGILDFYSITYLKDGVLYAVQVGAFKNKSNAIALSDELRLKGYSCYIVEK